jgi:hypothetical protein
VYEEDSEEDKDENKLNFILDYNQPKVTRKRIEAIKEIIMAS